MTIKWSIVPEVWSTTNRIFVILDPSLHFYPHGNNLKNQTLDKNRKNTCLGDIIILHMCTIYENHMMYGSWYMEHNRHNFLSFWTILSPFTPLTTRKTKIWKKGKKPWRYYHFTHAFDKWQTFLLFWKLFCPFTPLKKWKKQNKTCRNYHFANVYLYHTWKPYDGWFLSIMDRILCHFRPFFALLPQ